MSGSGNGNQIIEDLYRVIESRRGGDAEASYTASLFKAGRPKITKKIGEEAVEVAVAALSETSEKVISESADLLYHLLVLWAEMGIQPDQVWAELESRAGTSGLAEKASRAGDEN
jgi:phosphoribosyl-ATP pyrophosphohydrolase